MPEDLRAAAPPSGTSAAPDRRAFSRRRGERRVETRLWIRNGSAGRQAFSVLAFEHFPLILREMTADEILAQFPDTVATTGSRLRQFLLKHLKGITEQPDPKANVIGYSYGAGYKDLICTIILSKKGIKLGFYKGSELPDPKKLLTGSGKVHRYVEINSEEDIRNPALLALLEHAVQAREKRLGAR